MKTQSQIAERVSISNYGHWRTVSENPVTGYCRTEVPAAAARSVDSYLRTVHGVSLEDVARRGRWQRSGKFRFGHGGGYATVDMDLLGGDGTGRRLSAYESWVYEARQTVSWVPVGL